MVVFYRSPAWLSSPPDGFDDEVLALRYVRGMNITSSAVMEALRPLYRLSEDAQYTPLRTQLVISIVNLELLLEMLLRCENFCMANPPASRKLNARLSQVSNGKDAVEQVQALREMLQQIDPDGTGTFRGLE